MKSTSEPKTNCMLTLSTMTATPSTSKTWSSSLTRSKASAYWKPEQPPPRTATRRAWSPVSPWLPSSSPIFSTALGLRVIASVGVSVTSQSVATGLRESRALSSSAQTAVVCDTTAYLPDALVEKRGIERISLYASIDGHQEAESEITDFAGFYERLRASEGGATTSQPSIGDFLSVYEPLLDAGREIVSIHISAGHLRHLRGRRPGPRPAHRRRQGRRAGPHLRLALGGRRDGALRAGRLRPRPRPAATPRPSSPAPSRRARS